MRRTSLKKVELCRFLWLKWGESEPAFIMNMEIKAQTATCASCQYWYHDADTSQGECRRHAPQMLVFHIDDDVKFESRFPATLASDWCGDYEHRESV